MHAGCRAAPVHGGARRVNASSARPAQVGFLRDRTTFAGWFVCPRYCSVSLHRSHTRAGHEDFSQKQKLRSLQRLWFGSLRPRRCTCTGKRPSISTARAQAPRLERIQYCHDAFEHFWARFNYNWLNVFIRTYKKYNYIMWGKHCSNVAYVCISVFSAMSQTLICYFHIKDINLKQINTGIVLINVFSFVAGKDGNNII